MKDIRRKAVQGVSWSLLDRVGGQGIGFLVTIILTRIILPSEFGLVAMASVVIAISRIFIDSGLNDSLIQKRDCNDSDYNTVFYFNLIMSGMIFLLTYISAPFIASFFNYNQLTPLIRVLGFKPVLAASSFVQLAIVQKELKFSTIAKIRIPSFVLSGFVGIMMAWQGYGVWALVVQSILESLFFSAILWVTQGWRPTLHFDKNVLGFHWKHGSRLLVVNATGALYRNIFSLIIGKFFSAAQLGYYSRADSFRAIMLNNTTSLVQTVSYPLLAQFQDDDALLKKTYRQILIVTVFGLLPLAAVVIVCAKSIVSFVLTDTWLPVAPILVVLTLSVVFSPFNSLNLNIPKVKRRTDLLLRTDMINKILLIVIVLLTVNLGFEYLVMTNLIISVLTLFINNYYTNRLIRYSIIEQLTDLWPMLVAFMISVGAGWLSRRLISIEFAFLDVLVFGVITIVVYFSVVLLLKRLVIFEMLKLLKSMRKPR